MRRPSCALSEAALRSSIDALSANILSIRSFVVGLVCWRSQPPSGDSTCTPSSVGRRPKGHSRRLRRVVLPLRPLFCNVDRDDTVSRGEALARRRSLCDPCATPSLWCRGCRSNCGRRRLLSPQAFRRFANTNAPRSQNAARRPQRAGSRGGRTEVGARNWAGQTAVRSLCRCQIFSGCRSEKVRVDRCSLSTVAI
jgi:hypothetical protein